MTQPDHDDAWYEIQYSPSRTVADVPALLATWSRRAAATRAARPFLADVALGPHPREACDLFRAANPKGTVVFIHGGYWQAFSKVETAWVAEGIVDSGYSAVLLDYPLCPEVSLEALTDSVRRSYARLYAEVLTEVERASIVVTGHSAGGHLTAALVATDWTDFGLPAQPFHGAVPISGLFELAPLTRTSINAKLGLTPEVARALSPVAARPRVPVPLTLVVGEAESAEFHRQGEVLAQAWASLRPTIVEIPGANHFTVIDGLAQPGSLLNTLVTNLLRRRAPG